MLLIPFPDYVKFVLLWTNAFLIKAGLPFNVLKGFRKVPPSPCLSICARSLRRLLPNQRAPAAVLVNPSILRFASRPHLPLPTPANTECSDKLRQTRPWKTGGTRLWAHFGPVVFAKPRFDCTAVSDAPIQSAIDLSFSQIRFACSLTTLPVFPSSLISFYTNISL